MTPSDQCKTKYRFAAFELDVQASELRKHGIRLRLQDQPLKVLAALLARPGELVTREELRERLWAADTFVDFEKGLNTAVARLRRVLNDTADAPRYIETHARHGYRFIGSLVTENGAAPDPEVPAPLPNWRRAGVGIAVLSVLLLSVLAWKHVAARDGGQVVLEQLTSDLGLSTDPAVSTDGKLMAYSSDRGVEGIPNIWVQQLVSGGKRIQLTHSPEGAQHPAFSPDGSLIAFTSGFGEGIHIAPSIGGEARQIAAPGRDPRFSPDGKWIAYWTTNTREVVAKPTGRVYVASASGGEPREVACYPCGYPIWAPDSRRLLAIHWNPESGSDWVVVPIHGGDPEATGVYGALKEVGFRDVLWPLVRPFVWAGDSVIFAGQFGSGRNIWSIRLPVDGPGKKAEVQRLTSGTMAEGSPSVAPDGGVIYASANEHATTWSLPIRANEGIANGELERLNRSAAPEFQPSVTPDGRYAAYSRTGTQSQDIYLKNLETGAEAAIAATEAAEWHPRVTRDGKRIAYTVFGPKSGVYVARAGGGTPERVSETARNVWDWDSGDRRLLFGGREIFMLELSSKQATNFLSAEGEALFQAQYSPDYQWLAVVSFSKAKGDPLGMYVVPLRGSVPAPRRAWIPVVTEKAWTDKPRWSPDGNRLYFVSNRDGYLCIWSQRVHPVTKRPVGEPAPLQHIHGRSVSMTSVPIGGVELEVARDRLLITLGELTGNIWSARPAGGLLD